MCVCMYEFLYVYGIHKQQSLHGHVCNAMFVPVRICTYLSIIKLVRGCTAHGIPGPVRLHCSVSPAGLGPGRVCTNGRSVQAFKHDVPLM